MRCVVPESSSPLFPSHWYLLSTRHRRAQCHKTPRLLGCSSVYREIASIGIEATFDVGGVECANIECEIRGNEEIVVIGAHYDSVIGSPGADDNATGVAAGIELARRFTSTKRTVRFVAFANEEPPHFGTPHMGSFRYAQRCKERGENIVAMLSLETIGYFTDAPKSQQYPAMLNVIYPSVGNFIAFVSNLKSRALLRKATHQFRQDSDLPSVTAHCPK